MKRLVDSLPAIFLDKDGTLIRDVPYNVDPRRIELMTGAGEGAAAFAAAGFAIVIVSNQSGVARGMFEETAIDAVEDRIRELLADYDVPLAGFYYCPHHPHGAVARYSIDCDCRKPAAGMLQRAAQELSLDLRRSWMIGDILDDVEAGHRAGCHSVLIDNGHETLWQWNAQRRPDLVAANLLAAAQAVFAAPRNILAAPELVT